MKPKWIKSEEQLPDFLGDECNFSDAVLVYLQESAYYMIASIIFDDNTYWWTDDGTFLEPIENTYWMSLPNKPKM